MYTSEYSLERPAGLRRRSLPMGTVLWRIDADHPSSWEWNSYPSPRHRFDSATRTFRTRYGAQTMLGAARERYLDTGLLIPDDHSDHWLVRLTTIRRLHIVDLRTEANLKALEIDDRINTSHERVVFNACHRLVDALRHWWPDIDGIVYRSRTTPSTSYNIAFFATDALECDAQVLGSCKDQLNDLVLRDHFTINFDY